MFWRVDIDIRAQSVSADDHYDVGNPDARSDSGWLAPASSIETSLAEACATQDPNLTSLAAELSQVVDHLLRPDRPT